jgi:hypothetical protein
MRTTKNIVLKLKSKEKEYAKSPLLRTLINSCMFNLLIDQTSGLSYEERKRMSSCMHVTGKGIQC